MAQYRATFFKNLVNSEGHQFKCLQGTFEIRRAKSPERALEAAERRFDRTEKTDDWTLFADLLEMERFGSERKVLVEDRFAHPSHSGPVLLQSSQPGSNVVGSAPLHHRAAKGK